MRILPALIVTLFATSLSACAGAMRPEIAPAPIAVFDYSPTGCKTSNTTPLTLAIVAGTWRNKSKGEVLAQTEAIPMQQKFADALRDDFLELVTCRGYATKGPFKDFDEMVFPEREASNLLLEPVLEANVEYTEIKQQPFCEGTMRRILCATEAASGTPPSEYTMNGTLIFGGRVTLSLKEPLTNTRMWTKSIDIGSTSVPFTGTTVYSAMTQKQSDLRADVGFLRALTPKLEEIYSTVLLTADRYLNQDELKLVATQADGVRKRGTIAVPKE